jgi:hypothetical protein
LDEGLYFLKRLITLVFLLVAKFLERTAARQIEEGRKSATAAGSCSGVSWRIPASITDASGMGNAPLETIAPQGRLRSDESHDKNAQHTEVGSF